MLSTPLFRAGDRVHRRPDLHLSAFYAMLHHGRLLELTDERLDAMCQLALPGEEYAFEIEPVRSGSYRDMYYQAQGWYIADEMFVEGDRVMRHLVGYL